MSEPRVFSEPAFGIGIFGERERRLLRHAQEMDEALTRIQAYNGLSNEACADLVLEAKRIMRESSTGILPADALRLVARERGLAY